MSAVPYSDVCRPEAHKWLECLEPLSDNTKNVKVTYDSHCVPEREVFDKCVAEWRRAINDPAGKVQVKGSASGLPPPQCAPLSCLTEKCLYASKYNFSDCKAFMSQFKHCVLLLYGKEFVD